MNPIYLICTLIISTTNKIFFKKINIVGRKNVTNKNPLFLYGNHSNAFYDSIVVHFALNENIYTLTRGDVFSSKLKTFLLKQFHILPIYRLQEGFENLHKNSDTFSKTTQLLKLKNKVMIFPEGNCIQEKRLRKFKKGMARMAYSTEAETNFTLGLKLLPVAINYTNPSQFRSEYQIVFGHPIDVKKYEQEYLKNPVIAINKINAECEARLKELMVIINDKENDEIFETYSEIFRKSKTTKQEIANKINGFDTDRLLEIRIKINDYNKYLKAKKIRDWVVLENENGFGKVSLNLVILIFAFPIYLIGLSLNYLAFKLPYLVAKKSVKNIEFFTSINLAAGGFIWVILYTFYILISSSFINNGYLFIANFFVMPITGMVALYYWEMMKKTIGKFRWLKLIRNSEPELQKIVELRQEIITMFK